MHEKTAFRYTLKGYCTEKDGRCIATSDEDCLGSSDCKKYGYCTAKSNGYCVK